MQWTKRGGSNAALRGRASFDILQKRKADIRHLRVAAQRRQIHAGAALLQPHRRICDIDFNANAGASVARRRVAASGHEINVSRELGS